MKNAIKTISFLAIFSILALSLVSADYNPDRDGLFGYSSSSSSHSDSDTTTDYTKTTTTTVTEHKQVKTNDNKQETNKQTNTYPSYRTYALVYSYPRQVYYQKQPIADYTYNNLPRYSYTFPSTASYKVGYYSTSWSDKPSYNKYNYPSSYNTYTTPYYYEPAYDWHLQVYNWNY